MSDYEQTVMDLTLEAEADLKENTQHLIRFALQQTLHSDTPPAKVRNRHEAYGIVAEKFGAVSAAIKGIKGDAQDLLNTLPDPNRPAVDAVSSICNSTTAAAILIINMAAEMNRVLNDLYIAETSDTSASDDFPMEDLADADFDEAGDDPDDDE